VPRLHGAHSDAAGTPRSRGEGLIEHHLDGFVLSVPKKNVEAYRKVSKDAGKVWMEHGALEYRECSPKQVRRRRERGRRQRPEQWAPAQGPPQLAWW
jgi:hypothetical protein